MKIYTSYYAIMRYLPDNVVPISIAQIQPRYFYGKQYKLLAPSASILNEYKISGDARHYTNRYINEVLNSLKPDEVVRQLKELSGGKDVCLVCYERSGSFCHRKIVSVWLKKHGYECEEFKYRE